MGRFSRRMPIFYVFLVSFLSSDTRFFRRTESFGINYGQMADNLPSPDKVVELLNSLKFTKARIYDTNPRVLSAFANSNIKLIVTVENEILNQLDDPQVALQWVTNHIKPYVPATKITGIHVGNEVFTDNNVTLLNYLGPVAVNIHNALNQLGIGSGIQVSSPSSLAVLQESYPPSAGSFKSEVSTIMYQFLNFLSTTKAPFWINAYPYFAYNANPSQVSLDYALFNPSDGMDDPNTKLHYDNMLYAQVDAVIFAIAKMGFNDIEVRISETGWPSRGDANEMGATVQNAATYNRNLLRRQMANEGTPLRPKMRLEVYLFALFNEDLKPGPAYERNHGLFQPDECMAYNVGLLSALSTTPLSASNSLISSVVETKLLRRKHSTSQPFNAATSATQFQQPLPSPPAIQLSSKEGKKLFSEAIKAGTLKSFLKLSNFYDTQSELTFCGLSTLIMTLNYLGIKPKEKWEGQPGWFVGMLDDCVSLTKVKKEGITVDEFVDVATCVGAYCKHFYATESNVIDFRKLVEKICSSSNDSHVIVSSYNRPSLEQTGTGHFTVIGGYHKELDMVLILDVARYKYPPHWAPLPLLWKGMTTIDETTGLSRGFIIVSRPQIDCEVAVISQCKLLPDPQVIEFASQQGQHFFLEALEQGTMEGFLPLISYFKTQLDSTRSGLTTLSMVLNALGIDPQRRWKGIWRWFDEDMLLHFIEFAGLKEEGMSLIQIANLVKDKGIKVETFRSNIEDLRKLVINYCCFDNQFVIISGFDKSRPDHWSPIGGYHKEGDMILILDVDRFHYRPYWIPFTSILRSISSFALHSSFMCEASIHQVRYMIVSKLHRP